MKQKGKKAEKQVMAKEELNSNEMKQKPNRKHKIIDDSNKSEEKKPKYSKKGEVDSSKGSEELANNQGAKKKKTGEKSEKIKKYEKLVTKKGKVHNSQGKGQPQSTEKPDWMQLKKQKKELKEKRKTKRLNDGYTIAIKAKQIGEKLRRTDCSDVERKKLIVEAHDILKNNYSKLIFTHDISRIIQWLYKYSTVEIKKSIFNELKPCLLQMLQSKYAKKCIKVMIEHSAQEIKTEIVSASYGNIVRLMSSTVSAPILEYIYGNATTNIEKVNFKQEFYGDMFKQAKDKKIQILSDVYKTAPEMKSATLSAVKGNLLRILNKKLLTSSLVHLVLWEFFNECSTEDKNEMIVMLRSCLVELSQTKYGSKVATFCMWNGTNKDKKIMMKALKDNVKKVCMSEHGYRILLALFDSVDDTVLVKKIIMPEIQKDLTEIALNEHGKHVILYLVARRDPHYFPPEVVEYLQQGDNNETSKKPGDVKATELLPAILDPLLEAIANDSAVWMSNSSIAMVTLAVLKAGSGDLLKQSFEGITKLITNPESKIVEQDKEHLLIEHPGIHMVLKKLIQNDKIQETKDKATFGEVLVKFITEDIIQRWIKYNRGCFLLIALLENEATEIVNTLLVKLQSASSSLKSINSPGAKILMKKLK